VTKKRERDQPGSGPGTGVYTISVVAELLDTGVQNLRLYEQRGLLEPQRTSGGTRRYSEEDLILLRRITDLLQQGLNLQGIRMVLNLEAANLRLTHQLERTKKSSGGTNGRLP
jgi:MerR family transcriptional regulator/heat shock protein HspR